MSYTCFIRYLSLTRLQTRPQTRPQISKVLAQLMLFITICSWCLTSHANSLSASVDRDTLSLQETFTLTLRYGGKTDAVPDLTPLRRDFDILGVNTSLMDVTVNFDRQTYTDWTLLLAPKRSGVFTLPSLEFDGASSRAILMTIKDQQPNSNLLVTTELDKNSVYVQEQILLTIRLYTAVGLDSIELDPLEIKDAVVVPFEQQQFKTTRNGQENLVVETTFAIYPQSSGTLTIPSLSYKAWIRTPSRGFFSQMQGRQNNLVRMRTDEKAITIIATPPEFADKAWLPAKNLTLSEHWSHNLDDIKVGDPITRSITITAEGLTAGQITPIVMAGIDGLTFYPDQAQTDEQKSAEGVTGTRIETFAIVANRSGDYTLPAINIDWWDTVNQKMQTAQLPAVKLQVNENPLINNVMTSSTPSIEQPLAPTLANTSNTVGVEQSPLWLYGITLASLLLSGVLAILYWRSRRELADIYATDKEALAHEQQQENAAWQQLKRASSSKDFIALRRAVLAWAQVHWQDNNLHSLQQVAARTDNLALQQQLNNLDQALYRNDKTTWDSGELLQQIHACKKQKRDQGRVQEGLKPLYKS